MTNWLIKIRSAFSCAKILSIIVLASVSIVYPNSAAAAPSERVSSNVSGLICAYLRKGWKAGEIYPDRSFVSHTELIDDVEQESKKLDRQSKRKGISKKDKALLLRAIKKLNLEQSKSKLRQSREQQLCDSLETDDKSAQSRVTSVCHFTGEAANPWITLAVSNEAVEDLLNEFSSKDEDSKNSDYLGACEPNKKVTICHKTGSDENPGLTLEISASALKAHLGHGDSINACQTTEPTKTPSPTLTAIKTNTSVPTNIPTEVPTQFPSWTTTPTSTSTFTPTNTPTATSTSTQTPLGLGTFTLKTTLSSSNRPYGVVIVDLNEDGLADIVVANAASHDLSIFLGEGGGLFQAAIKIPSGLGPYSLVSADFNHDNHADIAVANNNGASVDIFFGDGSGGLNFQNRYTVGAAPTQIELTDINSDGLKDIIVANHDSNFISILTAQNDGSFLNNRSAAIGQQGYNSYSYGLTSGDFNGDLQIDLVGVNSAGAIRGAAVVLQNSAGTTFLPQVLYSTAPQPIDVESADFDRDGRLDLLVSNYGSNNITLLSGRGDGNFENARNIATGSYPMVLRANDINGDGKVDVLVANHVGGNIAVLLGDGAGNLTASGAYGVYNNPYDFAIGDLNNDGAPDFVATSYITNNVTVYLQNK